MQIWFEMTGHLKWLEQFAIRVGSAQKGGPGATHKGRLVKCQKGVLMSKFVVVYFCQKGDLMSTFVIVYYCQKADIKSKKCLEMTAGMKIWQIGGNIV